MALFAFSPPNSPKMLRTLPGATVRKVRVLGESRGNARRTARGTARELATSSEVNKLA